VQGVFGLSVRLVAGAVALVAALWVMHPGFDAACRAHTASVCLSGIWSAAPGRATKTETAQSGPVATAEGAIRAARVARLSDDLPTALRALDIAGQWALRHYEAEERQGANRRVRYLFVDLDGEARLLAAAAVKADKAEISGPAMRYAETYAALASVEGVDLVLRRANLRAPKSLENAILTPVLASAIREFWQDLAPVDVFFVTDREQTGEETGFFAPAASPDGAVTWGAATVNAPVYVNEAAGADQMRQVEDAPERGTRQTVSVRTVKHLDQSQFDARAKTAMTLARHQDAMIYLHGAEISFEHALIRAAELKLALRIDGPVAVIAWGVDAKAKTPCASAGTAKLVLSAWKQMAHVTQAANLHVVAHGQGVCAGFAPYDHGGDEAEIETPAANLVLLQPDYGHPDVEGPFHRAPGGADAVQIYFNQTASRAAADGQEQACPWDAAQDKRAAFSRPEKALTVHKIEIGVRPSAANGLSGADYLLDAVLEDLRAQLWTGASQPAARCGMCKASAAQPTTWRLFADRCGEQQTLALDLRRELGASAESNLDAVLKDLSPAERDMVRQRLKGLPPRK
jgi:hypothetical protein